MSDTLYEFAKQYKSFGWSIIPILPKSKKPSIEWKEYQSRVATDKEIKEWFKGKTTKEIGIGLVTGKVSNVIAVDMDSYKDGAEEINLNTSITSTTGGGGKHGLFQYREGIKNKADVDGKKIDIRGEGGYIVLPPSIHPNGNTYKWDFKENEFDARVKRLPAPPHELFKKEWQEKKDPLKLTEFSNVGKGSRNDSLYRVACSLVSKHGTEEAWFLVEGINRTYDPPLSEVEVRTLFNSASNFVTQSKDEKSDELKDELPSLVRDAVPWTDIQIKDNAEQWIWEGYLAKGNITVLSAFAKVGKSTFLRHLFKAIAEEQEFAGQPTTKSKIFVASEENDSRWSENKDEMNGLTDHVIVSPSPVIPGLNIKQWEELIYQTADWCNENKIDLFVMDTMSNFWSIESEDRSADMLKALRPFKKFTKLGIAVLLVHHDKKDGGKGIKSMRGSSAFQGFVDQIIMFQKHTEGLPTQRIVKTSGRFNSTDTQVVVEYTPGGEYITKGEPWVVSKKARLEKILDIVGRQPIPVSVRNIFDLWTSEVGEVSLRSIRNYCNELEEKGLLKKEGSSTEGKRTFPLYLRTGWEESTKEDGPAKLQDKEKSKNQRIPYFD